MKIVWLSHILGESTPLYGGSTDLEILPDKQIECGDSCNTSFFKFPSHSGTHVDAPYHFVSQGKTIDDYPPQTFIYNLPVIVDIEMPADLLIRPEDIKTELPHSSDLIIIRTGFEKRRGTDSYWKAAPGLAPELAGYFTRHCTGLRAVGMDFISISSLQHRETGRKAHRTFLENEILLFEDMRLEDMAERSKLTKVIALPVRFNKGDGSPCTVIGYVD